MAKEHHCFKIFPLKRHGFSVLFVIVLIFTDCPNLKTAHYNYLDWDAFEILNRVVNIIQYSVNNWIKSKKSNLKITPIQWNDWTIMSDFKLSSLPNEYFSGNQQNGFKIITARMNRNTFPKVKIFNVVSHAFIWIINVQHFWCLPNRSFIKFDCIMYKTTNSN